MQLPAKTAEIFKILSKGQFISANSANRTIYDLYNVIEEEDNFEILYQYFQHISFSLEKGDGYYYFSRPEHKVDLENKITTAYRWIDIIDFFKTFDHAFSEGFRFTPADILVRLKTDAELEDKLDGLKNYTGKVKHQDVLEKILKKMTDETFIELENEISHQYKVLAAFKYLEQLVLTINIPDEVSHEIPQ